MSFREAAKKCERMKGRGGLCFGGLQLPAAAAEFHFLVMGATGSGKTLTIRFLMQSVFQKANGCRALLYDAKRDLILILDGMGVPKSKIKIFNPFDDRSVAWDMAADITSPATAWQLAPRADTREKGVTELLPGYRTPTSSWCHHLFD